MQIIWPKQEMLDEFFQGPPKNKPYYDSLKAVIEENLESCGMNPNKWSAVMNQWALKRTEPIVVFCDQDATDGFLDIKVRARNALIWFSITDKVDPITA